VTESSVEDHAIPDDPFRLVNLTKQLIDSIYGIGVTLERMKEKVQNNTM
jgi:hypothetical protein